MQKKALEKKTRRTFHEIHKAQGDDNYIFTRLSTLLSTDFLKVEPDFFKGKICLDAGCGSNANATFNMLSLGAEKVYAFDLDETIVKTAPKYLRKFKRKYELSIGNVFKIHFPDNYFDFTHCAGVLHHTVDVYKGLAELARVTKKGGTLYFDVYGKCGLIREITTSLRLKYQQDKEFRSVIDNLDQKVFKDFLGWIQSVIDRKSTRMGSEISLALVSELFDKDLVLTIKDRLQAPLYHEDSEEELIKCLQKNGFRDIVRLTKYPRYKNVRRFLSPLYEQYDNKFARFLYGSGQIQLKAIKNF